MSEGFYYGNKQTSTTAYVGGDVPALNPDTLGNQFTRLTELVQHLRHVSSELQQRLTPVLSAPPPSASTGKPSGPSTHAPLVQAMREQLDQLESAIHELSDVSSRTRL